MLGTEFIRIARHVFCTLSSKYCSGTYIIINFNLEGEIMATVNRELNNENYNGIGGDGVAMYEISITLAYVIEKSSNKDLSVNNSAWMLGWRH